MVVRTLDLRQDLDVEDSAKTDITAVIEVFAIGDNDETGHKLEGNRIPLGKYLFIQGRGDAAPETLRQAVKESGREALWRGIAVEQLYYIRRLYEEGEVWQLFRPIKTAT